MTAAMLELESTTVTAVADESRGARIRARRERMGWSSRAFAARAGLSRATLASAEDDEPGVRDTTYNAFERALDALAVELGFEDAGSGIVRLEVPNVYGGRALIVQGPIEDLPAIEAAVDRIMRRRIAEEDAVEDE